MRKLITAFLILALLIGAVAYYGYNMVFNANVTEDTIITLPTGSNLNDVFSQLENSGAVPNIGAVKNVAKIMKFDNDSVRPGKYELKEGWNSKELISLLRSGRQKAVKVTYNNLRTKEELAGKISSYLEIDSATLVETFQDPTVHQSVGLTSETFLTLFIPNTYEMYWTTDEQEVVERFKKEHENFWSREDRMKKAENLDMTPEEVYTLASIVEKESLLSKERPIIAGLYLNRLKRGIPLQADPTVVYANGDFGLRRVLLKHLEFDSPYNTYKYSGLPPGPIYMPSIASIDAVLTSKDHNYLYMCASPEAPGAHLFAESLSEHNRNAAKYHRWLNSRGIR